MLELCFEFCHECGAAHQNQTASCTVCHAPLLQSTTQAQPGTIHLLSSTGPACSDALAPGALLAERYHIVEPIGEGGFGKVYQARDTHRRARTVAIKQISLDGLTAREMIDATDSYHREVRLLSRVQHSNLPRILDHFADSTHWYLVMDYIEGETLETSLEQAQHEHLSLKEVLHIGIQLSCVLGYLHQRRPPIVFRDVKPANIMRTRKGHLFLIDFGIARLLRPGKARDTGPLGSPGYAAPEQYGTAQSTPQTDIFGLGATLQTLLTGREPGDLTGATDSSPSKPSPFEQLLARMQDPVAARRPRSMNEVRHTLLNLQAKVSLRARLWRDGPPVLCGILLGTLPYSLLAFMMLLAVIPVLNMVLSPLLYLLSILYAWLTQFWPALLVAQVGIAVGCCLSPRGRPIALGIVLMLVIWAIAIYQGWIPVPDSFFSGPLFSGPGG